MKWCFSIKSSEHDAADNVILKPTKRSHRTNFKDKLDEHFDQIKLEDTVNSLCNSLITAQEIDKLDNSIALVLNSARKCVKGLKRTIPAS